MLFDWKFKETVDKVDQSTILLDFMPWNCVGSLCRHIWSTLLDIGPKYLCFKLSQNSDKVGNIGSSH